MADEKSTRINIIDEKLNKAGWYVGNAEYVQCEFYDGSEGKRSFADYVLLGKNGKPLAVVEAKSIEKDVEIAREQAKQYCIKIGAKYNCNPFCYYTNGDKIMFWDLGNNVPRQITTFPSREDLERLDFIRNDKRSLDEVQLNAEIAGRPYQIKAVRSVLESIMGNRRRQLLVMATGTGKTRVAISLVSALKSAKWIKRILFLVDRIALRDQALDAFQEYMPNELLWPLEGEVAFKQNRDIYVCTYPTMKNIIESDLISSSYFDLIIIDESHRSVYNTYGEILNYFDCIQVGLTATPTDVLDHNTFDLFGCKDGVPTFAYSYKEAVNNIPKYLCEFSVQKVVTLFQKEGLSKRTITLKEQFEMLRNGRDAELETINYEGTELENTVINKGTNVEIVRTFMEDCIKDENGVCPGKTIFFCMTKNHARRIEKIINELYPEYNGEVARVLVSDDPRVYGEGGLLDQFKNRDMPRIGISVDMLDTGVDVREVVNLVFAKPVYSYTKFWQMIGRGTRLLETNKIKPWCKEKGEFVIFDCWDNFEYFKLQPDGRVNTEPTPLPVRFFNKQVEKLKLSNEKNQKQIYATCVKSLIDLVSMLPKGSIVVKEKLQEVDKINTELFNDLDDSKITFLKDVISPLFRALSGVDFKAMKFEKDVLEASIFKLGGETSKLNAQIANIAQQVSELPLTVNYVAEHRDLIEKVQTKSFWVEALDEELIDMSKELAPLMNLRNANRKDIKKYDFSDKIVVNEKYKYEVKDDIKIEEYIKTVKEEIEKLENDNPILKKIKDGKALSDYEIKELEKELNECDACITTHNLRVAFKYDKASFLQLIKHIMGVEDLQGYPEKVAERFDSFISKHTCLTVTQLRFIEQLKEYCINNYGIKKKNLFEAPFTMFHPRGILGVFNDTEVREIIEIIEGLVA